MKVLHLISSLGAGGAEVLVRDLAIAQAAAGYECAVGYLSSPESIGRDPAYAGEFARELDLAGVRHVLLGGKRNPAAGGAALRRLQGEFQADVVHAHLGSAILLAGFAGLRRKVIYTHHASFFPFSRHWMRCFNLLVDRYVGVCGPSAAVLRPYAARPVSVVHNGRRARRLESTPPTAGKKPLRVLSVGNFVAEKDYPTLVDVAKRLSYGAGEDLPPVQFSIAGDGPCRPAIEAMIQASGLSGLITVLGPRTDVERLLDESDVLLSTSSTEALPMSMIEALQAGRPIVATRVGGVPEIVQDGDNGFLAAPGDVEAIAGHLRRLSLQPELRVELAEGSRRKAADFSIDACARGYAEVYEDVAAR